MGEMQPYTGYDPSIVNYVKTHQKDFKYKNIGAGTTDHWFYAVPESAGAKIKIEATDGFGRVYRQYIN
jgi:tripartite-type tricarboxylate transporter receptor subunit TctC